MSDQLYQYTAIPIGDTDHLWMVKRFADSAIPISYTEALIRVDTMDPEVAIKAAIERGSWA